MIEAPGCSIQFHRDGDAGSDTCDETKEKAKANSVSNSENEGIRYRPRKEPQRTVLSTQDVVS
jgi:hypothetical protein